jgi:hypothetical protein
MIHKINNFLPMILAFYRDSVKEVIKWWKRVWFEAKLKARLDMIELENRIESELEREIEQKPIYREHPIDPDLQTGESQKLGGAMQLTAPWYNDGIQPQRQDGVQEEAGLDDSL